jgi:hypothetical protein
MKHLKKAIDPKDWEMGRYYTKKALVNAQDVLAALDVCTSGGGSESGVITYETPVESVESEETLKNPEELEAQRTLKRLAELTLYEFEKSARELGALLGCPDASGLGAELRERSEEDLMAESLEDTREFYIEQTRKLQNKFHQLLSVCTRATPEEALHGKP